MQAEDPTWRDVVPHFHRLSNAELAAFAQPYVGWSVMRATLRCMFAKHVHVAASACGSLELARRVTCCDQKGFGTSIHAGGWSFSTLICEGRRYLPWLEKRFINVNVLNYLTSPWSQICQGCVTSSEDWLKHNEPAVQPLLALLSSYTCSVFVCHRLAAGEWVEPSEAGSNWSCCCLGPQGRLTHSYSNRRSSQSAWTVMCWSTAQGCMAHAPSLATTASTQSVGR
jgi:hypothetical protein